MTTSNLISNSWTLLDIGLPKMNGLDVAQQLVTMGASPKILFLTARARFGLILTTAPGLEAWE